MKNILKDRIDERLSDIKLTDEWKQNMIKEIAKQKRVRLRPAAVMSAACLCIVLTVTAVAANIVRNTQEEFYLRQISLEQMVLSDAKAKELGAEVYFKALESDNIYDQYFAINKLVEYYNDDEVRIAAIEKITPFLDSEEEKLKNAAELSLSILSKSFDHSGIYHLDGGVKLFTLFQNYSDYGSYNQLWMIKDDRLEVFETFRAPSMYITSIIPSPDKKQFAVTTSSNKSKYLTVFDTARTKVSPEIIDSARYQMAMWKGYMVWQRADYENYSDISSPVIWTDNETLSFQASLGYEGAAVTEDVQIIYNYREKKIEIKSLP